MICQYGCGQEAKFYFKTVKKWCCSRKVQRCPTISKKILRGHDKKPLPTRVKLLYNFEKSIEKILSKNLESIEKSEQMYNIILEKECWIWKNRTDRDGYGVASDENNQSIQAHRLSFKLFKDDIISKKIVAHYCDKPDCVNPNHLFLTTYEGNNKDRQLKNRSAFGKRNGMYTKPETRSFGNEKASNLWRVTSPNGETEEIKNLTKFCRDKNIPYTRVKNSLFGWKTELIIKFAYKNK